MVKIPHNSLRNGWDCPICNEENKKYISTASIVTCSCCHESLSLIGEKVVTFKERFKED